MEAREIFADEVGGVAMVADVVVIDLLATDRRNKQIKSGKVVLSRRAALRLHAALLPALAMMPVIQPGATPEAAVIAAIKAAGGRRSHREITLAVHHKLNAAEMRDAIQRLLAGKVIVAQSIPNRRGRPTVFYTLRSLLAGVA